MITNSIIFLFLICGLYSMNGFHLYRSQKGEQKFFYRSINVTEIIFRANFIVDLSKKSNNHDQDKQTEQKEQIAEKNNTQQPANRENISHIRTIEEIYLENIYDDFNSYPNINHADIDNHPLVQKVKGLNFKDTVRELKLTRQLSSLNETERGAIVKIISDFSILEPLIEADAKCQAEIQSSTKCEDYSQNLGPERSKPIKIGHLLLFGFESDVLEIHLHEIYDFVDKIFITEAERTHFMN
ncbi:hypothetical protein TRFO_28869 [Tritrichomonas foetus]|uniref:Uncharacterized protein n=1 Tax=Tritrichomonas foetus TaxID=1144522 RepID=A0A1J4K2F8_9EUKA|nr:hypothetical protein TRFO_28869 [Tritrichomonas foetus]|eukprot:OHT03677.1 hypothetical protein TRFO_28869 [Tritrichomonas foetus]